MNDARRPTGDDLAAMVERVSPRTAGEIAKARTILMAWAEATGNAGSAAVLGAALTARAVGLGLETP